MKLLSLIERYITYRQTLGESFKTQAFYLRAFGRVIRTRTDIATVRARQVRAFLDGEGPVTSTWYGRYSALRGFYSYAVTRGYIAASPLPAVLPQRPPSFVPHIYTQDELHRLLEATDSYQRRRNGMEPVTMRTLILLLYGTGLRLHEAVALDRADVDIHNLLLTVRQTKFYKTRLVPCSPKLGDALGRYSDRRLALPGPTGALPFFTMRSGTRVKQDTIDRSFFHVRARAGVRRDAGASYQPRLHDLRHSAARQIMPTEARRSDSSRRLLCLLIYPSR